MTLHTLHNAVSGSHVTRFSIGINVNLIVQSHFSKCIPEMTLCEDPSNLGSALYGLIQSFVERISLNYYFGNFRPSGHFLIR
jgi:hypothetical protein